MTFVVSSDHREYLRELTGLLFSAFPGSTIYEYMDAEEAAVCVKTHRISAVFIDGAWDAANEFGLLCSLRLKTSDIPVFVFADSDLYEEDALWHEATGYLIRPIHEETLRELMLEPLSLS